MNTTYPIAAVGEVIGEPARAALLIACLDGKARRAGELALPADVSAQSASAHLSKLVDGGCSRRAAPAAIVITPWLGQTPRTRLKLSARYPPCLAPASRQRARAPRTICTPHAPATTIWPDASP